MVFCGRTEMYNIVDAIYQMVVRMNVLIKLHKLPLLLLHLGLHDLKRFHEGPDFVIRTLSW